MYCWLPFADLLSLHEACQICHKISNKLNVNSNLSRSWNTKIALSKINFLFHWQKCQHIGNCGCNNTLKFFSIWSAISSKIPWLEKKSLKKSTFWDSNLLPRGQQIKERRYNRMRYRTFTWGELSVIYLKSWRCLRRFVKCHLVVKQCDNVQRSVIQTQIHKDKKKH